MAGQMSFKVPVSLRELTPAQKIEYCQVKFGGRSDDELWANYDKLFEKLESVNVTQQLKDVPKKDHDRQRRIINKGIENNSIVMEMILDVLAKRGNKVAIELQS